MGSTLGDLFGDAPAPEQKTTGQWNPNKPKPSQQGNVRTMPFGKHKGTPVSELPADYLIWLWWARKDDGKPLDGWLGEEVVRALESYGVDHEGEKPETRRSQG